MNEEIVKFIRRHDYQLVKELGQGACGKTVLLYDDQIDEQFVCKKFTPCYEERRQELFDNFVRETKILHRVYHENVVRSFNYYLYPEVLTGYILMEFIDGTDIEVFLGTSPELINEVFIQAISGFSYLEANGILHRDIRPLNLMVREDGSLKIIDFGSQRSFQRRFTILLLRFISLGSFLNALYRKMGSTISSTPRYLAKCANESQTIVFQVSLM